MVYMHIPFLIIGMGSVQFAALEKIFSNVSTSPDLFFSPSLYPAFVTPSAPVSNNSSTNRVNPTTVYIIIGCVIGGVAVLSLLLIFVRSRLSGTAYDGYPNTTSLSAPSVHTTASFYSTSEVSNVIAIQGERPILSQQSSFGVQPLQQKAVSIY